MVKAIITLLLSAALWASVTCMSAELSDYTYHLKVIKTGTIEHGTAVAIQAEGFGHFILTANHCVKDSATAELSNGSETLTAKVVFRDPEMDFAILKANVKKFAILSTTGLNIGTQLVFCHYPRGKGPLTSKGSIVEIKDGNINYFAHSDGFYHGSSGCPVFLKKDTVGIKDEVVGIALSGLAVSGKMIEGEAVFLPAKRIFQSMKAYIDSKVDMNVKAVIIDLDEKF